MEKLPKHYMKFKENYPDIASAYDQLGNAVHTSGPLDDKVRALIKLAMSAAAGMEGAVHSHTRKALEKDISEEEIRQTVLLALPTIGLPRTMAALSWVEDILNN